MKNSFEYNYSAKEQAEVKRIREKLDTDIITTVKGIGYRIDRNEE